MIVDFATPGWKKVLGKTSFTDGPVLRDEVDY